MSIGICPGGQRKSQIGHPHEERVPPLQRCVGWRGAVCGVHLRMALAAIFSAAAYTSAYSAPRLALPLACANQDAMLPGESRWMRIVDDQQAALIASARERCDGLLVQTLPALQASHIAPLIRVH
eukprot:580936-Prymnesium_polylepis.1